MFLAEKYTFERGCADDDTPDNWPIKVDPADAVPAELPPGWKPKTIKQLRNYVSENGTHSILDIEFVGSQPFFMAATVVPDSMLMSAFGTLRPSRKAVEEKGIDLADSLPRWEGYCCPVWESPAESENARWWFFVGSSGD